MKIISVKTKLGGLTYGRLDEEGRLVYLAGYWIPTTDPDVLNRLLRTEVAEIIDDDGLAYRKAVAMCMPYIDALHLEAQRTREAA